ncbi:hypothetical protein [Rhizobium viscosum]|uniref:Deacetylase sirtuin-type domain-containing protein n=1 Tax=Rhizobium viscosum TaxID=1673 RepID=A0ABR9IU38_RHIVS|nr:hypothetical protein [Rhizobium viscosum]MBE1506706.1 hypothetical protein [Rhizobium viscosum]
MATLTELCDANVLVSIGGGLDAHEQPERLLCAFPHVIDWLENTLPSLDPDFHEGKQDPMEQADDLFHDFVSGADFSYYEKSHSMLPTEPGVWELKTSDLRLFGWFASKGVFVVAEINSAFQCKHHSLYAGYRNSVVYRRNQLNLDEPKFITGEYEDVL